MWYLVSEHFHILPYELCIKASELLILLQEFLWVLEFVLPSGRFTHSSKRSGRQFSKSTLALRLLMCSKCIVSWSLHSISVDLRDQVCQFNTTYSVQACLATTLVLSLVVAKSVLGSVMWFPPPMMDRFHSLCNIQLEIIMLVNFSRNIYVKAQTTLN